jgi:hypothetical protein
MIILKENKPTMKEYDPLNFKWNKDESVLILREAKLSHFLE